ncbi:MAG: hypothetical protein IJ165_08305 [Proteobacteria bacterium]|nr:hypothetical protein [Pseudomonadota bacterium]
MIRHNFIRPLLCLCLLLIAYATAACSPTDPEGIRAWIRDKRAPVKMQEFVQNPRIGLDSKIEAIMVLTERGNCVEIPQALGSLKTDELDRVVAGVIQRMNALIEQTPAMETRVKDAAYYILTLEVNDDNRAGLMDLIRRWLDSDNFFLSIEKAGRVEQQRLFELLGTESIPLYKKAIEKVLKELDEALEKEAAKEKELIAEGKKYKVITRPSDRITTKLSNTLAGLEALKLPGAHDMVAQLFITRINEKYPNMPRALVLPFSTNTSEKLLPVAERIIKDPDYNNPTLNYYKDVMMATYYRKVQKKAGVEICTTLLQSDRTGYLRWDCLELLTIEKGRENFATLIQSLPSDYELLKIPADHPAILEQPSLTFWNSLRVYCAHLPQNLNNQVPLDVFRQLAAKGSTMSRMLSMACLSTLGTDSDVQLLASFANDKTDVTSWGMQVPNLGELANYSSALLEKRLANAKAAAQPSTPKADAANPAAAAPANAAKPAAAAPANAAKPAAAAPANAQVKK